jgi:hypothetical protein
MNSRNNWISESQISGYLLDKHNENKPSNAIVGGVSNGEAESDILCLVGQNVVKIQEKRDWRRISNISE